MSPSFSFCLSSLCCLSRGPHRSWQTERGEHDDGRRSCWGKGAMSSRLWRNAFSLPEPQPLHLRMGARGCTNNWCLLRSRQAPRLIWIPHSHRADGETEVQGGHVACPWSPALRRGRQATGQGPSGAVCPVLPRSSQEGEWEVVYATGGHERRPQVANGDLFTLIIIKRMYVMYI